MSEKGPGGEGVPTGARGSSLVFRMASRRCLFFLLALVIVPLGDLAAQAPASLTVAPAKPKPGAVVRVAITVDPAGDSIVAVRGVMAGEPLHFAAIAPGRYGAIGAVPVDSTSPTTAEAIVERASGRADTLHATVEPPPLPPPSEQLAVAPRFGQPMDSALEARVAAEAAKAREVGRRSHESPPLWTQPFAHPRPSAVTSRFGTGRTFNGVVTSRHLGVDFRGATGTPVFASNRGVVALLDTFYLGGRIAYVDHGAGVVTAYMHLSRFLVEVGDTVQRGQRIGLVGATGRVTGPHLHWAARYGSISVNPLDLVDLGTWGARRDPPPTKVAQRRPATVPAPSPSRADTTRTTTTAGVDSAASVVLCTPIDVVEDGRTLEGSRLVFRGALQSPDAGGCAEGTTPATPSDP